MAGRGSEIPAKRSGDVGGPEGLHAEHLPLTLPYPLKLGHHRQRGWVRKTEKGGRISRASMGWRAAGRTTGQADAGRKVILGLVSFALRVFARGVAVLARHILAISVMVGGDFGAAKTQFWLHSKVSRYRTKRWSTGSELGRQARMQVPASDIPAPAAREKTRLGRGGEAISAQSTVSTDSLAHSPQDVSLRMGQRASMHGLGVGTLGAEDGPSRRTFARPGWDVFDCRLSLARIDIVRVFAAQMVMCQRRG
jgi:hypothetical protein